MVEHHAAMGRRGVKKQGGCDGTSSLWKYLWGRLQGAVHFVTFDIDGAERTRRTEVFASSATDAAFGVDNGYLERTRVGSILRNHLNGACRAMAFAIAAGHAVSIHHAVLFNPYGMAHLGRGFLFTGDGLYGACWAHLRAACTLGTAIATLIGELGLHEAVETGGRTKHAIGAGRHTQLTGRAVLSKVLGGECTGRQDGGLTLGNLLVQYLGQSAIDLLLLGLEGGGSRHGSSGGEEGAARGVRAI